MIVKKTEETLPYTTTTWNYDTIKTLAKQTSGVKVTDLIALAPQNDPFYVGTPTDREHAQWFAHIWQRAGYISGVHLRRVHYWAVSQSPPLIMPDGKPYENSDRCWKFLTEASKKARYLGLVSIQDIVDRKNPDPHIYANYDWFDTIPRYIVNAPELSDPYIFTYGFNVTNAQPYHLEVWCEKSTMDDVLLPVCQDYGANLCTFEGEVSITSVCVGLMERIKASRKSARIFYISDFDPAGNNMPVATARKLEYAIRSEGLTTDVKLTPIALTAEQVNTYQLPRTPIKDSERRAASFEDSFGAGATELDALEALHSGELARIVSDTLEPYYDYDKDTELGKAQGALEAAVRAEAQAITARFQPEIAALDAMRKELQSISIDTTPYAVANSLPNVTESDDWLYSSDRDYLAQNEHYKAHKNGGR